MAISVKPHVEAALRSFDKHYEKAGSVPLTVLLNNGSTVSGQAVLIGNKSDPIHGLFSSVTEALMADALSLRIHVQHVVDPSEAMVESRFGVDGSFVFVDLSAISAVLLRSQDFHATLPDDGVDDGLDVVSSEPAPGV